MKQESEIPLEDAVFLKYCLHWNLHKNTSQISILGKGYWKKYFSKFPSVFPHRDRKYVLHVIHFSESMLACVGGPLRRRHVARWMSWWTADWPTNNRQPRPGLGYSEMEFKRWLTVGGVFDSLWKLHTCREDAPGWFCHVPGHMYTVLMNISSTWGCFSGKSWWVVSLHDGTERLYFALLMSNVFTKMLWDLRITGRKIRNNLK